MARQRRTAAAPAAENTAVAGPVEYEKPHLNVYTMMLFLSFVALVIGSVLLYMELKPYGDFLKWWQTTGI